MDKVFDRVKVGTATTGTGNLTLGPAEPGFMTWTAAGAVDGDSIAYVIDDGPAFEIGYGVISGGLLSRNVIASSNANTAINLSGNAKVYSAIQKRLWDAKSDVGHTHDNLYLKLSGGQTLTGTLGVTGSVSINGTNPSLTLNGDASSYYPVITFKGAAYGTGSASITGYNGILHDVPTGTYHWFRVNGVSIAKITSAGIAVETGTITQGGTAVSLQGHGHTEIGANDTRTTDDAPSAYATWKGIRLDFKNNGIGGLTGYHGALTIAPWSDDSGGPIYQLGFASDLYFRSGTRANGWNAQYKVWHEGNLTPGNYVLTSNFTFANLGGKPTTLAGYGITDAVASANFTFANLGGKPTTLAGYGITDAMHSNYVPAWADVTGKPTTLAGYGITDAVASADFVFNNLGGTPTTLAGYGITDAVASANFTFANLGGKPSTLDGYGITDAQKKISVGTVAPSNPSPGDLWVDTN